MANILPQHFDSDSFLPTDVALSKYKAEKIEPQLEQYRLFDHDSFKDFQRRKGQVIHSSRFILQLKKLIPMLVVQRQVNYENDWGLYLQRDNKLIFLCQVSKGWLTEFSYTTVDEKNLPDEPRWGWRHVLTRLMGKGVLSWDTVIKEFGNSTGVNAERWNMFTAPYRNRQASGTAHKNLMNHFCE
jgi:hypothetical protein